nr:uncharacterized protein LOC108083566 isoform X2 [Drosophila kikkawai]
MLQQIKMLVLGIITLCRRALCCFSRHRKMSHRSSFNASDQLTAVNVVVERDDLTTAYPSGRTEARSLTGPRERDWNSWDESPRTVEEHIEQYRQRMAQPPTPPKEEPEPDFFSIYAFFGTLTTLKWSLSNTIQGRRICNNVEGIGANY